MAKKPHTIRMEDHIWNKFKAISTIKAIDDDKVFNDILDHYIESMTDQEKECIEMLLKVWQGQD